MTFPKIFDALIVGAGPAGLSAALGLCRQRRSAMLFDSGVYRNAIVSHMHNVVTWDHKDPADFRAKALRELMQGRYDTVEYVPIAVKLAEKNRDGIFHLRDAKGNDYFGKKLLIASGVTDVLPEIDGFKETWMNSNIYHCLFCHGFEDSGAESAGVLAFGNMIAPIAAHFSKMSLPFAKVVTIYTNCSTEIANECKAILGNIPNITIDTRGIQRLSPGINAQPTIQLETDTSSEIVSHNFFVHAPRSKPNVGFAKELNLKMSESGGEIFVSSPFFETSVAGCFAAGDIASAMRAVAPALAGGMTSAGGVVSQL